MRDDLSKGLCVLASDENGVVVSVPPMLLALLSRPLVE